MRNNALGVVSTLQPQRILIVDDESFVRELLSAWFSAEGYLPSLAASAEEALSVLASKHFDLVLTDLMMSGKSGLHLLEKAQQLDPDICVLIMSGVNDLATAIAALKKGAYGYILKPLRLSDVLVHVLGALHFHQQKTRNRRYRFRMERSISRRAAALRGAISKVAQSREETIRTLGAAVEARDYGTERHAHRVAAFCRELGTRLGLSGEALRELERGAYLHDIGKVAVPDKILLKPGPLTPGEREVMKAHVEMGHQILEELDFLGQAASLVRYHHEQWDGSGYPEGLRREAIPLLARLFAIADAFDAMVHDRPYRQAMSLQAACREIESCAGRHFAPRCVEVFHSFPDDILFELAKK